MDHRNAAYPSDPGELEPGDMWEQYVVQEGYPCPYPGWRKGAYKYVYVVRPAPWATISDKDRHKLLALKIIKSLEQITAHNALHTIGFSSKGLVEHFINDYRGLIRGGAHENIARVLNIGASAYGKVDDPKGMWWLEEFVTGLNLRQTIENARRLNQFNSVEYFAFAIRTGTHMARALNHLHTNVGMAHLDFKPENVIIETSTGRPKVTDFGTNVMKGATDKDPRGSVLYHAPEQFSQIFRDKVNKTPADMWAFGVIFYELLTGVYPFSTSITDWSSLDSEERAKQYEELMGNICIGSQKELGLLNPLMVHTPELEEVIEGCLDKNPKMRITSSSALEILEDIYESIRANSPFMYWRPVPETVAMDGEIGFADLSLRSTLSDGEETPAAIAAMFKGSADVEFDTVLSEMDLVRLDDELYYGGKDDEAKMTAHELLYDMVKKSVSARRHLDTIALLDRDTLLGVEELAAELRALDRPPRLVVGVELSALKEIPSKGLRHVQVPVFFYDDKGFDILIRDDVGRENFFRTILHDYGKLIRKVASTNKERYLSSMRHMVNKHFFKRNDVVTVKDIQRVALLRQGASLRKHGSKNVINTLNSELSYTEADVAHALIERMRQENMDLEGDVTYYVRKYLEDGRPCFVPPVHSLGSFFLEGLLKELGKLSESSAVKVVRGIHNPANYVRMFADDITGIDNLGDALEIWNSEDREYLSLAETRQAKSARGVVEEMIKELSHAGLLEFIESDCPRRWVDYEDLKYHDEGRDDYSGMDGYLLDTFREMIFAEYQQKCWRRFAEQNKIAVCGGSRTRFSRYTGSFGVGYGEVAFRSACVDKLFRSGYCSIERKGFVESMRG